MLMLTLPLMLTLMNAFQDYSIILVIAKEQA